MRIKKIKPELVIGGIVGFGIVSLTLISLIPQKTLTSDLKLTNLATSVPKTEWTSFNNKEFGLAFEYHSSWDEPIVKNNATQRVIYAGPILITKNNSTIEKYLSILKKQKLVVEKMSLSNMEAYTYEQLNTNKINVEYIVFSKDKDSETVYEISYSNTKEEEKSKIDRLITSITLQ